MTDSEKLIALADWYDLRMPGNGDEVQQDLRRIANFIDENNAELHLAKMTVIEDDKLIKNLQAQLSSKEQECEDWKKRYNDATERNVDLLAENGRLKKENYFKELRKLWDAIEPPVEDGPFCRDCADGNGICDHDGLPCDVTDRRIEIHNRLRKRCEDLEAENSKLSKELTDIINGNAEAIPALVVMARDAFAAGRELYEASWIEGEGFIYKDFEDWESRS